MASRDDWQVRNTEPDPSRHKILVTSRLARPFVIIRSPPKRLHPGHVKIQEGGYALLDMEPICKSRTLITCLALKVTQSFS